MDTTRDRETIYYKNQIAHLSDPGKYRVADTLFLNVTQKGSRSWVQRVTVNGVRREKGLGGFPAVSLEEAKQKAMENRMKVRTGEPLEHEALTFEFAMMQALEKKQLSWKKHPEKTTREWIASLENHALPILRNKKVTSLIGKDFYDVLMPLWSQKKFDMADVIRKRLSTIMAWCCEQGYIQFNPVQNITKPKNGNGHSHFRAVHYSEVSNILQQVKDSQAMKATKALFEFQVLCACRPSEAREAEWDQISLDEALWVIPASQMKMNQEHRVPLSTRACELLHEIAPTVPQDASGLLFSHQGRTLNRSIITALLKDLGIDSTAHGMRAAFRSFCADHGVSFEVAEMALSHSAGRVVAAYQRSDLISPRRELMGRWADYLIQH